MVWNINILKSEGLRIQIFQKIEHFYSNKKTTFIVVLNLNQRDYFLKISAITVALSPPLFNSSINLWFIFSCLILSFSISIRFNN